MKTRTWRRHLCRPRVGHLRISRRGDMRSPLLLLRAGAAGPRAPPTALHSPCTRSDPSRFGQKDGTERILRDTDESRKRSAFCSTSLAVLHSPPNTHTQIMREPHLGSDRRTEGLNEKSVQQTPAEAIQNTSDHGQISAT